MEPSAVDLAARALARRDRCETDLRRILERKGVSVDDAAIAERRHRVGCLVSGDALALEDSAQVRFAAVTARERSRREVDRRLLHGRLARPRAKCSTASAYAPARKRGCS